MTLAIKVLMAIAILGSIVWLQTAPQPLELCAKRYDYPGQGIVWQCKPGLVSVYLSTLQPREATLSTTRAGTVWIYPGGVGVPSGTALPKSGGIQVSHNHSVYLWTAQRTIVWVFSTASQYGLQVAWGSPR